MITPDFKDTFFKNTALQMTEYPKQKQQTVLLMMSQLSSVLLTVSLLMNTVSLKVLLLTM